MVVPTDDVLQNFLSGYGMVWHKIIQPEIWMNEYGIGNI
jgi:hypothetical protein